MVAERIAAYHNKLFLAMAKASVRPSVTLCDPIQTKQARMTNSSLAAPRNTLLSGSVNGFQKFERGHPDRER